jgi:predicted nucleic acid-binding protein
VIQRNGESDYVNGPEEIIVDAGPLIALASKVDHHHRECMDALKKLPAGVQLITTVSVLTEVFAVLPASRIFVEAVQEIMATVPIRLQFIQDHELPRAFELMAKYVDLPMDFADAEILVVAERKGIKRIFTIDRRDFSIYKPKHIRRMQIIP